MNREWLRIESPYGAIAVEFDPVASGFDARGRRTTGAAVAVWLPGTANRRIVESKPLSKPARQTRAAFERWLAGDGAALDEVGVIYDGTDFQQRVLREMRRIKAGSVASYGELALAAGKPNAARAVGSVCANNKIPLAIPCHRVLRSGGAIGEYAGRPALKRALLALEGWSGAADAR